jgi:hypothetical protein
VQIEDNEVSKGAAAGLNDSVASAQYPGGRGGAAWHMDGTRKVGKFADVVEADTKRERQGHRQPQYRPEPLGQIAEPHVTA